MTTPTQTSTDSQPHHYPLVCPANDLSGAEARANAFPWMHYDWCIRYALLAFPGQGQYRPDDPEQAERLEYLQHKSRTLHRRRWAVR